MSYTKSCIIIAGPTAVGKTKLAIDIARHFSSEIISFDSRQCYAELNIGVARPSPAELSAVPHHFIASHHIDYPVTAIDFENYALKIIDGIFTKSEVAVLVGGTGLYLRAFCYGLDAIPEIDHVIRAEVQQEYKTNGMAWLQQQVQQEDPVFFAGGEQHNPHRLLRALEVKRATGESIRSFQQKYQKTRPFNIIPICLDMPREFLYQRINQRVDEMMKNGLLEEVKNLFPYQHLQALQTVGYRELFSYLNGETTVLQDAVTQIKINSRHYAKRQLTWFKKEAGMHFLPPDTEKVLNFIHQRIAAYHTGN